MDRETADIKLLKAAKTIFSYCLSRTSSKEEAEDLTQDILLEILRSQENIRDDKAFYGFMWAVAGNVYKNWCKKRGKSDFAELDENLPDDADSIEKQLESRTDLSLLRRELSLLSEKYRKASVLYYFNGLPVSEIAKELHVSESMVKYLLFKARQILKEGMNMERTYGEQSYNPKQMSLLYMGEGPNQFWKITDGRKIPQNILWACYNDSLTEEEISLQIGVALPYLENEITTLLNAGLLIRKGNKYSTNIIIISKDFKAELASKIAEAQNSIADRLYGFICQKEAEIRSIGFYGCHMSRNSYLWQMTCIILNCLLGKITERFTPGEFPVTAFGEGAYVWGEEEPEAVFNFCNMEAGSCLKEGEIHCMDWLKKPKSNNNDFHRNPKLANFFIKAATGKAADPNEYEKEMLAELIQKGYAVSDGGKVQVTMPVYTHDEIQRLYQLLLPVVDELLISAEKIKMTAEEILKNHMPSHLKEQAKPISCMRMLDDVIGAAAQIMHRKDYLKTDWEANEVPTVFIIADR